MAPRLLQAFGHLDKVPELWRCFRRFENWPGTIWHFLDLPGSSYPLDIRTRSGLHVTLQEFCDVLSVWEMYCRNQYRVSPDAQTIIDLGANIGVFAIWAAHRAERARIFSFEPFPSTFQRLVENVNAHGLNARVTCYPAGVAASSGTRVMSDAAVASSARSLASMDSQTTAEHGIAVKTIALPDLITQVLRDTGSDRIDVLKMDIEGAEHEIIPQIEPAALQAVQTFELEYHPVGPKQPLFDALKRAGFDCVHDAIAGPDLGVAHFDRVDSLFTRQHR